jgi:DNA-binding transcriptional ArsR family regulator
VGNGRNKRGAQLTTPFDALADPTRREVLMLLGERPRRAGELAEATGASPAAMSRHLRVLLTAGLVSDSRPAEDARGRVFRLRPEGVGEIEAWLTALKEHWQGQLASYPRHVEERSRR